MTISKEHLETAVQGLEVLIKRGEKALEMIREQEEHERRNPFFRITFADPKDQAQADRDALEHERGIRDRLASRKVALKAFKSELK